MALHPTLQGDTLIRRLQGAAAGAVVTLVIGFTWGGWVTSGTARGEGAKRHHHRPRVGQQSSKVMSLTPRARLSMAA